MSHRNLLTVAAALALAAAFAIVLAQSVLRRADASESYPAYSSLNNDENGTKAYFEALARLGFAPSRNYKTLGKLAGRHAAIFYAGSPLASFRYTSEKDLEQFEAMASRGARLLLVFDPEAVISVEKPKSPAPPAEPSPENSLKKRWGVEVSYAERAVPGPSREFLSRFKMLPVNWRFSSWSGAWTPSHARNGAPLFLERAFGQGAVVLISDSKLFTNRELLVRPDIEVLASAPGAFHDIVFDESHLGLADTGTVVGLATAHGLAWVLLGFVALAALYVWRASVSFLPVTAVPVEASVAGRDAHLALSHLLMQSIPAKSVLRVAAEEWNRCAPLLLCSSARTLASEDLDRLDDLNPTDAAAQYRSLAARLNPRLNRRSFPETPAPGRAL
ncbi:MAG: DUF4350 domain-containing protein [Acidobacteriaceae bacterium]|nr:DUF4350 domain-containing protein [Acidobacteriaceae bacterium]